MSGDLHINVRHLIGFLLTFKRKIVSLFFFGWNMAATVCCQIFIRSLWQLEIASDLPVYVKTDVLAAASVRFAKVNFFIKIYLKFMKIIR